MKYLMFLFLMSFSVVVSAGEFVLQDDSNWYKAEDIDSFTENKNVYFAIPANEEAARLEKSAALFVRCLNNQTEMFINTGRDFFPFGGGDYVKIGIKIDDEKPYYEKFTKSSSSSAAFFQKPINFLKNLKGKSKIILRYQPYGENEKNATFEIKGINQVIDEISETCKWPKK